MSRLIVTVPIQLSRDNDGFWLQVKTPTNQEAITFVGNLSNGPMIQAIWNEWAEHTFKEASLKARRSTGVKDHYDKLVWEGDLVRIRHSDSYPSAVGVVTWEPKFAAFVLQGDTERHGPWQTNNLAGVNRGEVIGNIFEHPRVLVPASYQRMPDQD